MFFRSTAPRRPIATRPGRANAATICLVLALCAPAFADENPLTLASAQRMAVQRSRQLASQDAAVAAAREMAVAAGQLPDPVLKAGIDNLPVSGADRFNLGNDFMTMRRIGVAQELTRADKRQLRAERFEREADKTRAARIASMAAIERDTALAWLERHYAEQMMASVDAQAVQAKQEIDAAEGAYRAGRGTQADILAARSAFGMVIDRASELQRRVRNARTMLARWTGVDADALAGPPAFETIRLDPATLDTQLVHHPEIAMLNRQEEIAQTEAKLAQANKTPDWNVEVAFQQRGPAYSNMISIGVSLPLQWDRKNRQDQELAAKLAMVDQAKAERDEMLREHIAATRTKISDWKNGRERLARYQRELIPLAGERTAATIAAYRGGKASLTEVLAARRNDIELRLQALQLEMDTARLWAQLNFLLPSDNAAGSNTHLNGNTQ